MPNNISGRIKNDWVEPECNQSHNEHAHEPSVTKQKWLVLVREFFIDKTAAAQMKLYKKISAFPKSGLGASA
jgi:hypothetical protein